MNLIKLTFRLYNARFKLHWRGPALIAKLENGAERGFYSKVMMKI